MIQPDVREPTLRCGLQSRRPKGEEVEAALAPILGGRQMRRDLAGKEQNLAVPTQRDALDAGQLVSLMVGDHGFGRLHGSQGLALGPHAAETHLARGVLDHLLEQ